MDDTPESGERKNPWPWIVAIIAVLVVGGLAWAWAAGMFEPAGVPVPDVRGQTLSQADAELAGLGLSVGATEPAFSADVDAGIIIDQSPSPGITVEKESKIDLIVSKGIELLTVPDLVGETEADASRAAREAGFELDVPQRKASNTVKKGDVVSQSPKAQEQAARGSLITLVISEGPELKQVPNVVGKSQSEAQKTLTAAGLKSTTSEEFSESVAKGVVVSQSPGSGVFVKTNTTIALVISKGPERISVPDVTGKGEAEATTALEDLGLQVTVNYQISPDEGFVLTQDPLPGDEARRGDNVTIWVGKAQM